VDRYEAAVDEGLTEGPVRLGHEGRLAVPNVEDDHELRDWR
jgi:hypothetical protein